MKETLVAGLETTRTINVDKDRTIGFMGEELRVYATPKLVSDIEWACRDLLLEYLDGGEDSVGTRVEVDHMAPTLLGMNAEIKVSISSVEGRLITFDIDASDSMEKIAKGKHVRFIVGVEKTAERLRAKAEKCS